MKAILFPVLLAAALQGRAQDSTMTYQIPDSVKALAFYTEWPVRSPMAAKKGYAAISAGQTTLQLLRLERYWLITLQPAGTTSNLVATGIGVSPAEGKSYAFRYNGPDTGSFRLLLVTAPDTATHTALWSGYVFLPQQQKWKLLATVRLPNDQFIRTVSTTCATGRQGVVTGPERMAVQRSNGSWRTVGGSSITLPPINWLGESDSTRRSELEKMTIRQAQQQGRIPALQSLDGVYYVINEKGTGRPVKLSDTVSVYYKGYLLRDSSVFDQTMPGKPARFPLARLIRGWQVGVPLINEGGKITLVIPSGLAYSIRTRSPKIPPNSILVFEIEVVRSE